MRITNSMFISGFLRNLYNNNKINNHYGMQLSTNKRIVRLSDDPIGALKSIQARKDISVKQQYKKNVDDAKAILTQTEESLTEVNNIYQRIIELAGAASTDIYSETEKAAIAKEIRQLQEALISIGNSSFAGKYIFGGFNTAAQPFELDQNGALLYNGINICANNPADSDAINSEKEQRTLYEIDQGIEFNVLINGIELMGVGENNLYKILDDFAVKLEDPTTTAADIVPYKDKFKKSHEHVLDLITEVGSRISRLELVEKRFEDDLLNLEDIRSKIEDIDQAEVITKMKMAENIYHVTLAVGARIIQPTLLDFLR